MSMPWKQWFVSGSGALALLATGAPAWAQEAAPQAIRTVATATKFSELPWDRIFETFAGGFGIVMAVLGLLTLATSVLNRWDGRCEDKRMALEASAASAAAKSVPSALAAPAAAAPAGNQDLEAVIAAAIAVVLRGRRYRVSHVQLAEAPSSNWSQLGRVDIHTSHRIQKRT